MIHYFLSQLEAYTYFERVDILFIRENNWLDKLV